MDLEAADPGHEQLSLSQHSLVMESGETVLSRNTDEIDAGINGKSLTNMLHYAGLSWDDCMEGAEFPIDKALEIVESGCVNSLTGAAMKSYKEAQSMKGEEDAGKYAIRAVADILRGYMGQAVLKAKRVGTSYKYFVDSARMRQYLWMTLHDTKLKINAQVKERIEEALADQEVWPKNSQPVQQQPIAQDMVIEILDE